MNKLELIIYNFVKDNPLLKQRIVDIYQGILGLVPQNAIVTTLPVTERIGYFYGFHDKTPFSNDGSLLLAHRILSEYRKLKVGEEIEVGIFNGEGWNNYIPLGNTAGWNWQMGSMLQWHGDSNNSVVYNNIFNGKHIGIVQSIHGGIIKQYRWPVVHVSPNQEFACSYNYLRVEKAMPGYGYVSGDSELGNVSDNYFRIFSCLDGKTCYKISLSEIMKISPQPSMEGAFHFFHHALFNPTSNRVFFLHRWLDKNMRRWTRMFTVAPNGKDLFLFPMDEMVSHITWASSEEIFAYLRYPGLGEGYFLLQDKSGEGVRYYEDVLNSDGHPTMDKRRGIIITDTYPDRFRNQYLVLIDIKDGSRKNLVRTHLPKKFKHYLQVDLHPRLHPSCSIACFDSAHNGKHSLMTVDYSEYLK